MNPSKLRSLVAGLALAAGLAACGSEAADTAAPAAETGAPAAAPSPSASHGEEHDGAGAASGSVAADDQSSDGATIVVQQVELDGVEQGFIGVHMDLDGKPGPVVGVAPISSGTTDDLVVTLDEPATTGDFWPMLHVDDGEIGTYEFPEVEGADLPVKDGEEIVMQQITLTVD